MLELGESFPLRENLYPDDGVVELTERASNE